MDFHYEYDTGHVWEARPRRGRTRGCAASLLRRFSRGGRVVQRHAHGRGADQPAAVDGRRVRTAEVQGGGPGALQAQQVSRAGGRERLAQRLRCSCVFTHDAGEI